MEKILYDCNIFVVTKIVKPASWQMSEPLIWVFSPARISFLIDKAFIYFFVYKTADN